MIKKNVQFWRLKNNLEIMLENLQIEIENLIIARLLLESKDLEC